MFSSGGKKIITDYGSQKYSQYENWLDYEQDKNLTFRKICSKQNNSIALTRGSNHVLDSGCDRLSHLGVFIVILAVVICRPIVKYKRPLFEKVMGLWPHSLIF